MKKIIPEQGVTFLGDAKSREEAENIIYLLGSKGYLEYRKLLKQHGTLKGEL